MTSPPAHLLPLALEAMTSADACEVLEDALTECEWWTTEDRSRVARLLWPMANVDRYRVKFDPSERPLTRVTARAIAAVLLFGEWSTTRWPLVEAHEVRERAGWDRGNPWALARPGSYFGINRKEPPTRPAGALADVWAQELDGAMRRHSRDLSYALTARMYAPSSVPIQHPADEEDDDADLG